MSLKKSLIGVLLVVLAACARQGFPEGGPIDREPPQIVDVTPANGTLDFAAKSFAITFDEYCNIVDADNNILVSPPLKPKPTYTMRGHSLRVTLPDTLQPNTTYLFQFKGAIADLNEGNKLQSFDYAFSTGSVIDSMTLEGVVLDAYSRQPRKDPATLMLYAADATDSAIANEQPLNITRTDDSGRFAFTHIKPGNYRLFAIEDADKNLRLGGNEAIAFLDSAVASVTPSDSTAQRYSLLMSFEEQKVQRIVANEMMAAGEVQIATLLPMQSPTVESDSNLVWRLNATHDTLRIWTLNPAVRQFVVSIADSTGINDTLKMQYRQRRNKTDFKGGESSATWCRFAILASHPHFEPLRLAFSTPLAIAKSQLDSAVSVLRISDSTLVYASLVADSDGMHATINYPFEPDNKYSLALMPNRLRNIVGNTTTDTIKCTTEVQGDDKFGSIIIKLDNLDSARYVVQLVDTKNVVVRSMAVDNERLVFDRVKPGEYKVQAFADHDNNGAWTPGNYWLHRQPEPIFRLNKTLNLRANWDIEETFWLE